MRVRVSTPARLHLGIIDMKGDLGRIYGSVGIAINKPRTIVTIESSNELVIEGISAKRAAGFAKLMLDHLNIDSHVKIRVVSAPPIHVGLGSGTQLALAIGTAICEFFGVSMTVEEIAKVMKRGSISGIGIYAFKYGGFIVDGGKRENNEKIPPLIFRHDFPEDWYFVICIPHVERQVYGSLEEKLMNSVHESLKTRNPGDQARIVLIKLLPSLIERDIRSFGDALTKLQVEVGKVFSVAQGGTFRDPIIEKGVKLMLNCGAYGAGQSSWGPAFYGLVESEKEAEKLVKKMEEFLKKHVGGDVFYVTADNEGAKIEK